MNFIILQAVKLVFDKFKKNGNHLMVLAAASMVSIVCQSAKAYLLYMWSYKHNSGLPINQKV